MLNLIVIVGTVLETPEMKETSTGLKYANVLIDTQRGFRNSEGEFDHDIISCTMWRGIAESSMAYCQKGNVVAIKGRIQSHPHTSEEGITYYNYDIVIEKISYIFNSDAETIEEA